MGVPQAPARLCHVRDNRAVIPPGVQVCPGGQWQRWAGVSGQYPRSAVLVGDVQDAAQQRGEGGALLRLLPSERGAWLEPVSAPAASRGAPSPRQGGRRCRQG